jgi:hypothetical protein
VLVGGRREGERNEKGSTKIMARLPWVPFSPFFHALTDRVQDYIGARIRSEGD